MKALSVQLSSDRNLDRAYPVMKHRLLPDIRGAAALL
jgi:hypothetical protein